MNLHGYKSEYGSEFENMDLICMCMEYASEFENMDLNLCTICMATNLNMNHNLDLNLNMALISNVI
jgi:hypothetical protein